MGTGVVHPFPRSLRLGFDSRGLLEVAVLAPQGFFEAAAVSPRGLPKAGFGPHELTRAAKLGL
jgi:hypothetical protein